VSELTNWMTQHWDQLKEFFNSVFFTSVAGSLAGAFAGAYGAQRIAERAKYRDQLLKEIRDTNAATMVAFGICNSLLAMKKQHVKALKENLDGQKNALHEHQKKIGAGAIPATQPFEMKYDFETLSLPPLGADILRGQIFERLSVVGRSLSLAMTLSQTLHGLDSSLEKRNGLIEDYKAGRRPLSPQTYFGLPLQDGSVNADYPATVDAIHSQTDDGIFFSELLCKDLVEHGQQTAARFTKVFRKGAPRVNEPDFRNAVKAGLMPNPANYADWLSAFKKRDPEPTQFQRFKDLWLTPLQRFTKLLR
jgi:hypothetical protein